MLAASVRNRTTMNLQNLWLHHVGNRQILSVLILGPYNPHYVLSDKGIQGEHDINTSAQIELEFTEKHHNCYKYLALISQHSYPGRQCWPTKISNYPGSLNRQVCTGINIYSKLQLRISRKYHYLQAVKEE